MANIRRYHPLVADDLTKATAYYDKVSVEFGNRFRDAIRERFVSITDSPESYACIHNQIRAALVKRFPYVVLFDLRGDVVGIQGVVHAASDQTSWFERSFD